MHPRISCWWDTIIPPCAALRRLPRGTFQQVNQVAFSTNAPKRAGHQLQVPLPPHAQDRDGSRKHYLVCKWNSCRRDLPKPAVTCDFNGLRGSPSQGHTSWGRSTPDSPFRILPSGSLTDNLPKLVSYFKGRLQGQSPVLVRYILL